MKKGYVIEDHHGDSGTVRVGETLDDLSDQRFDALKKRGLIREVSEKADPAPANKAAAKPANKSAANKAD